MPARKCCFEQMSRGRVPQKYLFSVKLLMFLSFNALKISRKKNQTWFLEFSTSFKINLRNSDNFFYEILPLLKLFNLIIQLSVEKDKKIFGSSTSNKTWGLLKKWRIILFSIHVAFLRRALNCSVSITCKLKVLLITSYDSVLWLLLQQGHFNNRSTMLNPY